MAVSPSGTRTTFSPVRTSFMPRPGGKKATAFTASVRPRYSNILKMLGPSWMPAPISPKAADCSSTVTAMAVARQHVRGGQAADAAAGDEEVKGLGHREVILDAVEAEMISIHITWAARCRACRLGRWLHSRAWPRASISSMRRGT